MTTPLSDCGRELGHRQANRLSRRFTTVGVDITPDRLRDLTAGAPATETERIDVTFALAVCELSPPAPHRHSARRLLTVGVGLLALCGLIAMTALIFSMAAHTPPLYS